MWLQKNSTEILNSLNPEQIESVKQTENHCLVLAGAGTGKTRVIMGKILYLIENKNINPWNIVAITFTNKVAREMRDRIGKFFPIRAQRSFTASVRRILSSSNISLFAPIPVISTFHSMGVGLLSSFFSELPKFITDSSFSIVDDRKRIALAKAVWNLEDLDTTKKFLWKISHLKNRGLYPEDNAHEIGTFLSTFVKKSYEIEQTYELYQLYQKGLYQSNCVDFEDLIALPIKLLENNGDATTFVKEHWKYILVDEYQDTNFIQDRQLQLFAKTGTIVTAVGDDDQAIYSFRGSSLENIQQFTKNFPQTKVIQLKRNYRSTQSILDAANSIIESNERFLPKKLESNCKIVGPKPILWLPINPHDEALRVVTCLSFLTNPQKTTPLLKWNDFAILYRTNSESRLLEKFLTERKIPYRIYGDLSFFLRKEIRIVTCYLQLLQNPMDRIALREIINTPVRGIGKSSQEVIFQFLRENTSKKDFFWNAFIEGSIPKGVSKKGAIGLQNFCQSFAFVYNTLQKTKSITESARDLYEKFNLEIGLEGSGTKEEKLQRSENVRELFRFIQQFQQTQPTASLEELLEAITLSTAEPSQEDQEDGEENKVILTTVHRSKGLEFSIVFLIGLTDDKFPHVRSQSEQSSIEEERRLLYVAVTRAKERLILSCPAMPYGESKPSRFLFDIEFDLLDVENLKLLQEFVQLHGTDFKEHGRTFYRT